MAPQAKWISAQLRQAVVGCGVSRYQIAKQIDVSQALLSRFVNHRGGLSLDVIDRLGELLGLQVVSGPSSLRSPENKTQEVSFSARRKRR
jgi:hypothetical protein